MTAYVKVNIQKANVTSLLNTALGKEVVKTLKEDDLHSLIAFMHDIKIQAIEMEKEEKTKGIDFIINILICKIVEEWWITRQLKGD